jgi:hypothetical protein
MMNLPCILFCEDPFESNKADPDYIEEFLVVKQLGFETLVFNFEDLTSEDRYEQATRKIKPAAGNKKVIYRGWMLTPKQYALLYNNLLKKNYKLINTVEQYQNCHYLPDSLQFIEGRTPKTIFKKIEDAHSIDKLVTAAKVFGSNPVILKDYVKSEKHDWETACFVPDATDAAQLKRSVEKLIELRGKYLNEGIVIRAFIELNALTIHSKSGMPLTEEYRLFFFNKKLLGIYDYWEEGTYNISRPDTAEFEMIASTIDNNFFTMDIARQKDGQFIIIELGDAQVAGLPDKLNKAEFYKTLKSGIVSLSDNT